MDISYGWQLLLLSEQVTDAEGRSVRDSMTFEEKVTMQEDMGSRQGRKSEELQVPLKT
jgi:hypothetical protein